MLLVGYVSTIGLYLLGTTQERFDKTRYLLNFAGMRSSSYIVGKFLADLIIYSISNILLVISVFVLQLDQFSKHAGIMFLILTIFGFPYIILGYNLGYFFDDPETAFKYSPLISLLVYAIPSLFSLPIIPDAIRILLAKFFDIISPFSNLNNCL